MKQKKSLEYVIMDIDGVDNNKTNKAQVSRFYSSASHHPSNGLLTKKIKPESTMLAK